MRAAMLQIFYVDCVHEWLAVNVNPDLNKLKELVDKAQSQIALNAQTKDCTDEFPGQ